MADDALYKIVYPSSAPGALIKISVDDAGLRAMGAKIALLPTRLKLASPPKGDLSHLSQEASPLRFERAAIAARFLALRPKRGDAQAWREAIDKDAALGELVVLTEPMAEWAGAALAVTLGEISVATGRIERTMDRLDQDRLQAQHTSEFHVADLERGRIEESVAEVKTRMAKHAALGAAQAGQQEQLGQKTLLARQLRDADPERLLPGQDKDQKAPKLKPKLKKSGEPGGAR